MQTEDYYNNNAEEFIERTFNINVSDTLAQFIQNLTPGAKVLDVGCGSGRDTLTLKSLGYEVTAFDASEELVKLGSQKISHQILHMKIEDMNWKEEFDGAWAMASLLHLKKDEMPFNLQKIMDSLKPDGIFFMCLKAGQGEGYDDSGRFFSYYSIEEVTKLFRDIGYRDIQFFSAEDNLKREIVWISALVKKTHELNLESKKFNTPKR